MTINAVSILREAVQLYRRHAASALGVSALLQVVYVLASIMAFNAFGLLGITISYLLALVATQMTVGVLTLLVLQVRANGEAPPAMELLREVLPRTGSILILGFLVGLRAWLGLVVGAIVFVLFGTAVAGAFGAAFGGIAALCLAIYLYVTAVLAAPALVTRRMGAVDAIKHSNELVKPQFWSVLVVVIVQGAVMIVGGIVARHGAADEGAFEDVFLAQAFVTTLVLPLTAFALAETFLELTGFTPDGQVPRTQAPAPAGVWTPHVPTAAAPTVATPWTPGPAQPAGYAAAQPGHAAQPAAAPYGAAPAQPYGAVPVQPYSAAPGQPQVPGYVPAPAYAQPAGAPAQPQPYAAPPVQPQYYAAPPAQPQHYAAPPAQPQQPYAPAPPVTSPYAQPPHTQQAAEPYAPGAAVPPYAAPPAAPNARPTDRSASVAPPGFG